MKGDTENDLNDPLLPPPTAPLEEVSPSYILDDDVEAPVVQHVIRAEVVENECSENSPQTMPIPIGRWRDGLCSCCSQGCCHPSLICSSCFPLVAIAQVMTRLKLSVIGTRTSMFYSKLTFTFLVSITIGMFILCDEDIFDAPHTDLTISKVAASVYSFVIFVLVFIVRRSIRRKYQIPDQCCGGLEDCCVAAYCPCLGISQMMRHTTDYSTYRAVWFSSSGVPDNAPPVDI